MNIQQGYHLTYCTNIHPGETWAETEAALVNMVAAARQLRGRLAGAAA